MQRHKIPSIYLQLAFVYLCGVYMNIRYATTRDAKLLSELGAKTFSDTFAKDNTSKNMNSYLKKSFSPEIQAQELSDPDMVFLIAESDGIPIGYATLIKNSRHELISGAYPLEVRRIYALQEYIGMGVGRELMNASINEAGYLACDCIWLGVWEKNQRAIDFYRKWGFYEVGTQTFLLGNDAQTDLVMMLELT
jgi:diamine N-acetyltransferase